MDVSSIINSIISTGPLTALLFFMWWTERKDKLAAIKAKDDTTLKHETYLRENADRLLAFSEEQRTSLAAHDKRIDDVIGRLA